MLRKLTTSPVTFGVKNLFNRYSNALIEKPYKTKMLTAAVLGFTGDAICQTVIEKKTLKTYDFRRTFNLCLIGTMISTPITHLWYMKGASAICNAVTKNMKFHPYISLVADQTLIASTGLSLFLFLNEYLRDFSITAAKNNVQRKFYDILTTNWKIWPPIILVNFLLIPPHFRVFFTNFLGFFWGIYLSYFQFKN